MTRYTVKFTGKESGIGSDVVCVGLRLFKDDEYYQFFRAQVAKADLPLDDQEPDNQWWAALVVAGHKDVRSWVESGSAPLEDPGDTIPFSINASQVTDILDKGYELPELVGNFCHPQEVASFELALPTRDH